MSNKQVVISGKELIRILERLGFAGVIRDTFPT